MELSKKLLAALGMSALLATSLVFTSCGNDDDDPEGAITGRNNNYSVYYDNSDGYVQDTEEDTKSTTDAPVAAGVYRAWKRTTLKHLGALTKITLKAGKDTGKEASSAGKNSGVMGFAWDLQTATGAETEDDTTAETFNVVGIRNYNGKLQAYVSRYYNITNKQLNNFGVTTDNSKTTDVTSYPNVATEYDVSSGFQDLGIEPDEEEVSVWVDVAIVPPTDASDKEKKACGTASTLALDEYKNAQPGAWVIAIYDKDPKDAESTLTPKYKKAIAAATDSALGSGYATTANEDKKVAVIDLDKSQKKQAVYTNIYKGATLSGDWEYESTYFLADVIED